MKKLMFTLLIVLSTTFVYGETENGGTSYLILSHVPFVELGLPEIGSRPVLETSETVMGYTVPFALGWGAVLSAVAAGVHLVNQKNGKQASSDDDAEESK